MPPMRFSFILSSVLAYSAFPALADNEHSLRQKLFEMDKVAALGAFDRAQEQACINALHSRYQSQYSLEGALAFNESFSLAAYDRLFWKGDGNLHRGLLFTGAVTDSSGKKAGNVICYYAITDYRLDFQSAYVLPTQRKEANLVPPAHSSAIGSSSVTVAASE